MATRKKTTQTTTVGEPVTGKELILASLWNAAESEHAARSARKAADGARVGAYDAMMIAGRAANGVAADFAEAYEAVKEAMKTNANGIAVKLELEPDSKKPGQYKVPGNYKVAASEVLSALKAGISLDQPFSKMREARKAAETATQTEAQEAAAIVAGDKLAIIRGLCADIGKGAELLTETQRDEAIQLLTAIKLSMSAGDAVTARKAA